MATTTPLSAKEVAIAFEVTPRTIRKFFRAEGLGVDKGNRYAFKPSEVKAMKKRFDAWVATQIEEDAE